MICASGHSRTDEIVSARSELLDPAKEVKPTKPAGDMKGVGLSAVSLTRQHVETLIMYNVYLDSAAMLYTPWPKQTGPPTPRHARWSHSFARVGDAFKPSDAVKMTT